QRRSGTIAAMTTARHAFVLALSLVAVVTPWPALVAEAQTLDEEVESALRELLETTPAARNLVPTAKGILVFPNIFRENYAFGAQSGSGALIMGSKIVGYYSTTSIAYGLQAGVLPFGYALFLMTEPALPRLGQPNGWNVGRDPGVALLSTGAPEKPDEHGHAGRHHGRDGRHHDPAFYGAHRHLRLHPG